MMQCFISCFITPHSLLINILLPQKDLTTEGARADARGHPGSPEGADWVTRGGRLGHPRGQTGSPEGAGWVTRGGRLGHPRGQTGSPEGQTGSPEGADWVTRGGRGQKSCIHAYVCMYLCYELSGLIHTAMVSSL